MFIHVQLKHYKRLYHYTHAGCQHTLRCIVCLLYSQLDLFSHLLHLFMTIKYYRLLSIEVGNMTHLGNICLFEPLLPWFVN